MAQRDQPTVYRILVDAHVDEGRADLLGDLTIIHNADGTTVLTGPVADQAALYGIILSLRDMGLELLDVQRLGLDVTSEDAGDSEED